MKKEEFLKKLETAQYWEEEFILKYDSEAIWELLNTLPSPAPVKIEKLLRENLSDTRRHKVMVAKIIEEEKQK